MALELVPLCKGITKVAPPLGVGGPVNRTIGELTDVTLEGERLSGSLIGNAAADWMAVNGAVGNIDVRFTVRTPDDALVYVSYTGKLNLANPDGLLAYVTPVFETSDERYAWLNAIQAAGKGILTLGEGGSVTIEYEFYELK